MRKEIQWFSELMNKRMEENADKDSYGWKHLDPYQLSAGIQKNGQNMIHGVNTGDKDLIINSAADIANYAMMIADNANREES